MALAEKKLLIDYDISDISITKQCELLNINRSSIYYKPVQISIEEVTIKNNIDKIYLEHPFYGSRRIKVILERDYELIVSRDRVRDYMREMGIYAIYPGPNLSKRNLEHKIYPYLLKNLSINNPRHVYSVDITYIPMSKGWMYLVAIIDWYSRYVVSWELDQTLELPFVIEALNTAIKVGSPEIMNSDQGSHFTSKDYIAKLLENEIKISMDHRGRAYDNIFIERLWRSVKYEEIYINDYSGPRDVRNALKRYFEFYNNKRPHQSLNYKTPAEIFLK